MAKARTTESGVEHDRVDVPANREYSDPAMAELDQSLVEAIEKADDAGQNKLRQLLESELTSLYYSARLRE